jgi:succinate-semialdehyde dehydrogenase/glutarate-semialdehyde dehydrogenase
VKADAKVKTLIKYLPMGIVYGIVPFNFPFYLVLKSGLPNLLLGNSLLSRSSDSTPLLGNKVEEIFKESGFSSG